VRLLLTRPETDAQRTAAALRLRGHTVVIAPLMHIKLVPDARFGSGPWAAILITSANAARAIAVHEQRPALRDLPVLAVGERSAQAMRAAGFADVTSAGGSVADLSHRVVELIKPGASLLYLAGAERSGDLAGDLRGKNFLVDTVVVYLVVAAARLPAAAADALADGIDGVLHFSRRSAEAYVNAASAAAAPEGALQACHFCLSDQVAEPLVRAGAVNIQVAPQPTELALIELTGAGPGRFGGLT
jgi:uroporphyrinogen-III synthase